ncbi:MAG: orotate phosphoribosyltransferase [Ferrimicrobium sp.]
MDDLLAQTTDTLKARLRDALLRDALLRGEFQLKSGLASTWFIDTKRAICNHPILAITAELALRALDPRVNAIGGLTMGADPIAFATATLGQIRGRDLHAFSVRKESKGYGQGGRIAGVCHSQDLVCVVEDTPSRGTSLISAVDAVAEAGAQVIQALAVVDRGGTAGGLLLDRHISFTPLFSAPDLGLDYEGGLETPTTKQS